MLYRVYRSPCVARTILSFALLAAMVPATNGQERRQPVRIDKSFPFADPQAFFKQFFGDEAAEEDREAIELIAIPVREERQIGQRAVDSFLAEKRRRSKVVNRGQDVEYLHSLVAKVRPLMKRAHRYRSVRIYLVESDETDARSFPGGTLVFFRGMLDFNENEAGLVGVIGHELSHLDREHQLYDAKRAKLAQKSFTGGGSFSPDQFLKNGMLLMKSFSQPFRPEEELEADSDGVRWAYKLGYDPREMAKLFLRMAERDRDKETQPAFFRSHPYHADRYKAAMDLYNELRESDPKDDLFIGRDNLAKREPKAT